MCKEAHLPVAGLPVLADHRAELLGMQPRLKHLQEQKVHQKAQVGGVTNREARCVQVH
jgi:hypothetical protein